MRTKSEVIDEIASPFLVFHFRVDGSLMWNLAQISSPCGLMVKALAFYNLSDLFMSKQGIGGSIPPRGFFLALLDGFPLHLSHIKVNQGHISSLTFKA